jgi:hypothetical protein
MKRTIVLLCALLLVGCQLPASPGSQATAPAPTLAQPTLAPSPAATAATANTPAAQASAVPAALIFEQPGGAFAPGQLSAYAPTAYPGGLDTLPLDLAKLGNPGVIAGLTKDQMAFLGANGFVVTSSSAEQFKDIRFSVSTEQGQPYFLTTDAVYHALHITFDDLLAALEGEYLRFKMEFLARGLYDQIGIYAAASEGQQIPADIQLARDYLAVALRLFNPQAELDPQQAARIQPQMEQIRAQAGKQPSVLIPGFTDDYGAYRPVGHYTASPELEAYFQGMTWLGRVAFKFKDIEQPDFKPSRAPLLVTLALRDAQSEGQPAYQTWAKVYEITDFMVGPSDDPGPVELMALMQQVYGPSPDLAGIADGGKWDAFLAQAGSLAAPRLNSTFVQTTLAQQSERDWRLMGQRFTLDGLIFQELIADKVEKRKFPSGLDVAAALGSPIAMQALEAAGATQYANYPEQMAKMQALVRAQPEAEWLNRFYSAWLYAFIPQVAPKSEAYPPLLRSEAWAYKDVNSLLGSWAELKHDTVLYAKMPEGLGGGGPPMSGPAPAYVEPNPDVFFRLAYAAQSLCDGLKTRADDLLMGVTIKNSNPDLGLGFIFQHSHLCALAAKLEQFGQIAVKENQGTALDGQDFETIQTCLELKECLDRGAYTEGAPKPDPIPVIAAVSGFDNEVLEAGVGQLNRIYAAVPLEGKLQIAQGGVFSYYEFIQPRSDRLTDEAWRDRLAANPPPAPDWVSKFRLPGGKPTAALAFRVGDVYILTAAGYTPPLNLRAAPGKSSAVVEKLDSENYLTIIDGPTVNADGIWWKVSLGYEGTTQGWVLENQDWYVRSHP